MLSTSRSLPLLFATAFSSSTATAPLPPPSYANRQSAWSLLFFRAASAGNLLADPLDVWWEMAPSVHGWGKVQLVERLCQRAEDRPDLRDWLLRHGCDNAIMP